MNAEDAEDDDESNSNQSEKYQTLTKEYLSLARDLYSHQTILSEKDQEKYQLTIEFLNSLSPNTKKKKFMRRKKTKE
jgi:hypothetical protein